jgi:hypothetical protein
MWTSAPLLGQIMGVALTRFGHLGEIRYAIRRLLIWIGPSFVHKLRRSNRCLQFSFVAILLLCCAGPR